jgi:hypothetical protein
MNAMRYRDIEVIARLFDPAVTWVDVAGGVACDGRDQALAWLRAAPTELNEVDAVELLANDEHVVLGIRNHARDELAGVKLEDGQTSPCSRSTTARSCVCEGTSIGRTHWRKPA